MVSPLTWKNKDPNNKGRGRGYYYKRYGYKPRHWSRYRKTRDAKIKASEKGFSKRYEHTGDKNTGRRTSFKLNKNKFLGWL